MNSQANTESQARRANALRIRRYHASLGEQPAAACGACGGWTSFGGMKGASSSTVPVLGRYGCTCGESKRAATVAASLPSDQTIAASFPSEEREQATIWIVQGEDQKDVRRLVASCLLAVFGKVFECHTHERTGAKGYTFHATSADFAALVGEMQKAVWWDLNEIVVIESPMLRD
jgi:hypothetical protein